MAYQLTPPNTGTTLNTPDVNNLRQLWHKGALIAEEEEGSHWRLTLQGNMIKSQRSSYVNDTFLTDKLDLEDMREWNQRPTNPAVMAKNNIRFAITTNGLKSPSELKNNILNFEYSDLELLNYEPFEEIKF